MPAPIAANLPQLIREASARALTAGALQPIETEEEKIDDRPMPFIVRWASSFTRRSATQPPAGGAPAGANPFLPYDPAMFVADLSPTHVLLLNKFPVYEGHVLIVTRQYAEQEGMLDIVDFHALAQTLASIDGIGFLNGGRLAGASQPHRHMQVIPIERLPVEALFTAAMPAERVAPLAELPFVHAGARLDAAMFDDPAAAAVRLHGLFREACALAGIRVDAERLPPYNLLVTRRWLLVVPRRYEAWEADGGRLPLNAMSFAGVILARERSQQTALRQAGLMKLLAAVTYPRDRRGRGE
jgi:ATP adenylyltransferase